MQLVYTSLLSQAAGARGPCLLNPSLPVSESIKRLETKSPSRGMISPSVFCIDWRLPRAVPGAIRARLPLSLSVPSFPGRCFHLSFDVHLTEWQPEDIRKKIPTSSLCHPVPFLPSLSPPLAFSLLSGVLGAALDSSVSGSPRRSCGTVGTSGKADYTRRAASWRDGVPVAVSTEYVSCIRVRNFQLQCHSYRASVHRAPSAPLAF